MKEPNDDIQNCLKLIHLLFDKISFVYSGASLNKLLRIITEKDFKRASSHSVFGSPNQKVGQFAQTKLGDYGG